MGLPGIHTWAWTLFACLSWRHVGRAFAGPQYMVLYPAVLEAGVETKFCASLLQPNGSLVMTVTLMSAGANTTLLEKTSDEDFHTCVQFQAPSVKSKELQRFAVEVKGNTFHSKEVRKVLFYNYQPMTFVQTDKPIYLPGQTVHFRVVSLDTKLRPANQTYYIIELQDSRKNRIGQWLNQTSSGKILQLSYSLSSEAREGQYSISVKTDEREIKHQFKVETYVLPKFEVQINTLDEISTADSDLKVDVCAKYTFGQPVPGSADLKICQDSPRIPGQSHLFISPHFCETEVKKMEANGCATFNVSLSKFKKPERMRHLVYPHTTKKSRLDLEATVTETGTGIKHSQWKRTQLSSGSIKIFFIDTPNTFIPEFAVQGKVKAVHSNNLPAAGLELYLRKANVWSQELLEILETDRNGVATFSVDTSEFQGELKLTVDQVRDPGFRPGRSRPRGPLHVLRPKGSPGRSSFAIRMQTKQLRCDTEETISIQYVITDETEGPADIVHLVLSRGAIVTHGFNRIELKNRSVNSGEVSFQVHVTPDMAPQIQVFAYTILLSGDVVTKTAEFPAENCFNHKVSLEFSPSSAVPGEDATMQVTAQPDSLCGVNVVDQSVLVKEPGKILDADKVLDLLPVKKVSASVLLEVEDFRTCINGLGMKVAANLRLPCHRPYRRSHHSKRFRPPQFVSRNNPPPIESIRSFFPETWIWDLVEIGDSGRTDVSVTAPDTITTWETEAFCLSPQGFGLAPRQKFTVFQPFFLELTMPYSVIRGEEFELKATIYSYLDDCMMVSMKLLNTSDDKTFEPFCLCEGERRTLNWTLPATELGNLNVTVAAEAEPSFLICKSSTADKPRIDEVTRSTIVKPEGTEMTNTYNFLRCPYGGATSDQIVLNLPADVLDLSARASVSVSGDILGRALANFDKLLKLPAGSGEQNMAGLAPIVYILHYLNATNQLSPAIREKSIDFLTKGLQTEQNYRYKNGAYSAFGSGGENTWLTAFVLRFFTTANPFIYIDPALIVESKNWLKTKQHGNGCFKMSGKLFNNRMQGGVSDEVTLTAYVTSALLSAADPADNPVIEESLRCLKDSLHDLSNTYTTALLAYVFTLAGDNETRDGLLQHLDTVAIREGDFLHWSQKSAESSASLSVETTAYVLLAKIASCPTGEEIAYGFSIFKWLMGQQNSYGGFSSTQDTVVALQALALYSTLVFSPDGSSTVTVQYPGTTLTFEVNPDNKLLYQEMPLLGLDGNIGLEVKGSACASVQIVVDYNVPTPAQTTTFSVKVKTQVDDSKPTRPKLTLKLQSLYSGQESETNLAILDITLLSGFVPDEESVKKLWGHHLVERVETSNDHVLVYLRALPKNTPINHSLDLVQVHSVKNLKSAAVKLYDYYEPRDQALTEYGF